MKSRTRLAACVFLTGLFGLSACVFPGPGYDRNSGQAQARDGRDHDRHDEGDRRCDSDHRRDDCQDVEHH